MAVKISVSKNSLANCKLCGERIAILRKQRFTLAGLPHHCRVASKVKVYTKEEIKALEREKGVTQ